MRQFVKCSASCSAPADWFSFRLMCDRSCVLRWMSSFFYFGAITLTYFYILCAWTTYKHRPWHLHFFLLLYLSQLVSTSNSSTRVCMLDLASRNNLPNLFHCHAEFVQGEQERIALPFDPFQWMFAWKLSWSWISILGSICTHNCCCLHYIGLCMRVCASWNAESCCIWYGWAADAVCCSFSGLPDFIFFDLERDALFVVVHSHTHWCTFCRSSHLSANGNLFFLTATTTTAVSGAN